MINLDYIRMPIVKGLNVHTKKPVIMQDTTGVQPPYPFTAIKVTLAGQALHRAAKKFDSTTEKIKESQDSELVVSITSYSQDDATAHDLAQLCRAYFMGRGKIIMEDSKISVVGVEDVYNRDVFLTVEYERRYGFDIRLRMRTEIEYMIEIIENVDMKGDRRN